MQSERLTPRHVAEHHAALGLVGLRRLDQRDHHGVCRHLVVLHHRVGDVLAQRGLLLLGAVADGVDDDLGHDCFLLSMPSARTIARVAGRQYTPPALLARMRWRPKSMSNANTPS